MSLCTGMVPQQQNAKNKKEGKEFMIKLFDAAARMNEIEKRKLTVARRLQFLKEKMAEVPEERQESYSDFVKKSLTRLRYGATAQEIWHDWQWRSTGLPAYFKNVALAAGR